MLYWEGYWTEFRESYQPAVSALSVFTVSHGVRYFTFLELTFLVCKMLFWEGKGEELWDEFNVLYDCFTKGLENEALEREEQERDKKNREDEREKGRKRMKGKTVSDVGKEKLHTCPTSWIGLKISNGLRWWV